MVRFEFDLATPFFQQLLSVFEGLGTCPLSETHLTQLKDDQGVYGLSLDGKVVYIGKADNSLPTRLRDHRVKLSGRLRIPLDRIEFKAVYLAKTWVPLTPEARLITHYHARGECEWNGNGFGPHDPGRRREETNKPPEGFDAQYPINSEWACTDIKRGAYGANELLQIIKAALPFCFRYETDNPRGGWSKGSVKYNDKKIEVPSKGMPAGRLIATVAKGLGPLWQATQFPSHIILYEEQRDYRYGTPLR